MRPLHIFQTQNCDNRGRYTVGKCASYRQFLFFFFRFLVSLLGACRFHMRFDLRRVKRINFIQFLSFHEMYKHITTPTTRRPRPQNRTPHLGRASEPKPDSHRNENPAKPNQTKPYQTKDQTRTARNRPPCLHCTFAVMWDFSCPKYSQVQVNKSGRKQVPRHGKPSKN